LPSYELLVSQRRLSARSKRPALDRWDWLDAIGWKRCQSR
jgi:hypothetical protein